MSDQPPLKGVRVLDFTQLLPGPLCTLYLADLGAEVIKIEPPGGGDPVRGPRGYSPMFVLLNRNKRSLQLDLREAQSQQLLHALANTADVVVEGFRPGVAARLGVGWPQLKAINRKLVYCSITGYGQDGPLAQSAGHDINYQCLAGVLQQTGSADSAPAPGNFPVADIAGGALSAFGGILAALFDAARSGHGRHVDIAMSDCLLALNVMVNASWQASGQVPPPGGDFLSGGIPCYHTYRTLDGRYLAVGALEAKFWQAFCQVIERPHLIPKAHAQGNAGQAAIAEVAGIIASHSLAHWIAAFNGVDACVTPVLRLDEVAAHPHPNARQMLRRETHPHTGTYLAYACPLRMGEAAWPAPTPAPALGADNAAIMLELAQTFL